MCAKPKDSDDIYNEFSVLAGKWADYFGELSEKIKNTPPPEPDPLNLTPTFFDAFAGYSKNPEKAMESGLELYSKLSDIWVESAQKYMNGEGGKSDSSHHDKRFRDSAWDDQPYFRGLKEAYISYANWLEDMVDGIDGLDKKEHEKLKFYTEQFLDAICPANFPFTNPEVMRETLETNGENLTKGFENFVRDIKKGKISQVDLEAFELGKNLATTKGQVVFQNDLMQLIQYEPTTKQVFQTPLLFIPAWINKFYIADLSAENSLVKWLVDKGITVFMISWVNPTEEHKDKDFADYMKDGVIAAIDEILKITGEKKVNAMGYCLGGTLLATSLAYMQEKKIDKVNSASFLTTLLDFSDVGDISVFIDDEQLDILEKRMSEKGYLDGNEMALTFSMLRSNDLIWSFVINNYLLGKAPFPFDILYWNADATRMPAKMHSFYLRNMYLKNLLVKKKVELDGVKIDLSKITTPSFFLSTKKDHISPWKTTYEGAKLFKNAVFALADSGHVSGVVNPPAKAKYNHWMGGDVLDMADKWQKAAKEISGSWWESWLDWNKDFAGKMVAARKVKNGIEPAPGSYVKQ